MRFIVLFIFCSLLIASCHIAKKPSKKEIARMKFEQEIRDSLNQLAIAEAQKKRRAEAIRDSIHRADSIAAIPPPINYDTVLVASLLRTPCIGKCPHYEIYVYESGYCTYQGFAHVERIGFFEGRISPATLEKLKTKAKEVNYHNFALSYPLNNRGIEDFPMCVTSFRKDFSQKVVYNRNEAPVQLVKYEQFFDSLFINIEWERHK